MRLEIISSFKAYFKTALGQSLTKDAIAQAANDMTILSKVSENAVSHASSFGIGIGLAFLGEYLADKKRDSPIARAIARLLGADVNAINRDSILAKLKD